jgi:hypothetical protein
VPDESANGEGLDLDPEQIEEDDSRGMTLGAISFDGLTPTEFEEFCFDLVSEAGFINVDWRKGTPLASSPADRGRDIEGELEREEPDGQKYTETWFVDAKHYERGVPPEALQGAITWAQAQRPDVVLFIASGYLTNAAKDWIAAYMDKSHPPFRIRTWERPQLRRLIAQHMDVAFSHDVHTSSLRRVSEIFAEEAKLGEALWYGRKPQDDADVPPDWAPEIVAGMRAAQKRCEEEYGRDWLMGHVQSDFAWGMLSGKISALRWILGEDWDMLDS